MQFLFQPLTWGFLLVGVPILVHLINMLRHRKQSWAAMDFLLESYRKHRRWVLLKQWLLLASRILAMLLLVAMLARWISNSQSLGWFGSRVTHHYVLLDDSFSMAEVEQGKSAYARGLAALSSLIRSISAQPGEHQLTLLRLSRADLALRGDKDQARIDMAADLIAQTVPRDVEHFLDRIAASEPVAMQLSAEPAVELITPLVTSAIGEPIEIHFITDLRRNEWGQPEALKAKLAPLVRDSAKVQFIDCAEAAGGNLAVVGLQPEQETWAAGVPLMVSFQVRNHGQVAARNVVVQVRTILYPDGVTRPASDVAYSGQVIDVPPVVIEQIAPGETVTRQVQVVFAVPGQHVVEIALAEDRLLTDNRRWCVIGIRQTQQVLLIDSSADPNGPFFLKTALQPDGRQPTGMSIETRDASFLRDTPVESLATWDVIVLLEVPRLDEQAVTHLEDYVRRGGGLAIWVGPSTNTAVVNEQLSRNGAGLFPVSIESQIIETAAKPGSGEPQVIATDHPILAPLMNLSSSPFQLIEIRRMFDVVDQSLKSGQVEVVAYGPNRRPLILDKSFGEGHSIAVMTGLTGGWSTWAQDPTFVVLALRTMGYLGSFRRQPTSDPVATPIAVTFPNSSLLPKAEVLIPSKSGGMRAKLEHPVSTSSADAPSTLRLGIDLSNQDNDGVDALLRPGIYELWGQSIGGDLLVRNVARNVSGSEGNLAKVTPQELQERLQPIKVLVQSATAISDAGWSPETTSHSTALLAMLIVLLLAEQALAYSASYHVPKLAGGGHTS